jgi:electron transfer flavoprotein alpha subunit
MILVYTQNWDGKFKKLTYELLSYSRALADQLGVDLAALSLGEVADDELENLAKYGADKILNASDIRFVTLDNRAFAQAITNAAEKVGATVVIMANDFTGKAVAPVVSVKMNAGLVSGVSALPESTSPFVVKKKVFTGKALAKVQINSEKCILTLENNSFELTQNLKDANIEAFETGVSDDMFTTKVFETDKVTNKIILTDADIVVSGGRGMKSPDNWQPILDLAEVLGAGTACSRPVSDEGWRPEEEHVGQTGKIIAPTLYFAFGISGAIQHIAGVSGSKTIVAVNTDPEAPIFDVADYGIVGDVNEVIPRIVEAAKAMK